MTDIFESMWRNCANSVIGARAREQRTADNQGTCYNARALSTL